MATDEKTHGRSLLTLSIVVVAFSFAIGGLAWFDLIPDTIEVPILWSLPVVWVVLSVVASVVFFTGAPRPRHGDDLGLRGELRRLARTLVFAGVGGLIVGLILQALLNEVFWLCEDFFTGGVYNPACRPLRFINTVLPWIFGGISLLVMLAIQVKSTKKPVLSR